MNLSIINCNKNLSPLEWSSMAIETNTNNLVYLVNNGLDKESTIQLRLLYDTFKNNDATYQLFEYSQKVPSGKIVQDMLTAALNDDSIAFVSFDNKFFFSTFEEQRKLFATTPCLAVGFDNLATDPDYNVYIQKSSPTYEFLSQRIVVEGETYKPSVALQAPFTLNLSLLRQGIKNMEVFTIVQKGFEEGFNPTKEVSFPCFFNALHRGFSKAMHPHVPLLAKAC